MSAIERESLSAPVITVIGNVVSLRDEIGWFEKRPLFGRRVVVTRASAQANGLRTALADLGADVVELPSLRVEPMEPDALDRTLGRVTEFEWIVFTSQNAVRIFWNALRGLGLDARALNGRKVACIGRSTSDALLAFGIAADLMPERFVAEGVLEAMSARDDVRGSRVLYVAAEGARDVLPSGLGALGCAVDVVPVYRSVSDGAGADQLRDALSRDEIHAATFASASSVRGYVDAVGAELARKAPAVSIGPVTSNALREAGITVAAEAREASIAALAEATVALFG